MIFRMGWKSGAAKISRYHFEYVTFSFSYTFHYTVLRCMKLHCMACMWANIHVVLCALRVVCWRCGCAAAVCWSLPVRTWDTYSESDRRTPGLPADRTRSRRTPSGSQRSGSTTSSSTTTSESTTTWFHIFFSFWASPWRPIELFSLCFTFFLNYFYFRSISVREILLKI